ncbi:hypothetical protein [Brevundimonas goettingensis]|uniref:Uncharacterized protein n=1 Tax=Brevundimonas goettingensis TaxID=2774190 RepID=A0A975GVY3_9CAUL|nr:hypothetical protein [Brevundimonas goettingensis]QTC92006.1 hypothetical protein IFJ75_03555 [Brevundimonas goettingensis]
MQTLIVGMGVLILIGALFAMAINPGRTGPTRFTDADADGEPDETPEEKRRGLEGR